MNTSSILRLKRRDMPLECQPFAVLRATNFIGERSPDVLPCAFRRYLSSQPTSRALSNLAAIAPRSKSCTQLGVLAADEDCS